MEEEFNVLASLRSSHSEYNKFCSQFSEDASQKERWMLHFDIGKLLVDNEEGPIDPAEPDGPQTLRYLFLEGIAPKEARILQNYVRKKFKLPSLNSNADIVDTLNGDLIELKVARYDNENLSDYLKDAREKAIKMNMGLVIVDVNTGKIIQEPKVFFKINTALVTQTILERRAKMKELGIVEVESVRKPIISKLPFFILTQFNKMKIDNSLFFNPALVEVNSKNQSEIETLVTRLETKIGKIIRDYSDQTTEYVSTYGESSDCDFQDISNFIDLKAFIKRNASTRIGPQKTPHLKLLGRLEKLSLDHNNTRKELVYQKAILSLMKESLTNVDFDLIDVDFPVKINEIVEMKKEDTIEVLRKCHEENQGTRYPWKCPINPISKEDGLVNVTTYELLSTLKMEEPDYKSKDWENDYIGFNMLVEEYKINPKNVLELGSETLANIKKNKKRAEKILDLFGVGWKEYRRLEDNEEIEMSNTKMKWERPIHEIPEKSGNVYWMEAATENFEKKKRETFVMPFLAKRDFFSRHPIDYLAATSVNHVMRKLIFSNILHYVSVVENFYNKFGGVLSIIEQKKTKSGSVKREKKRLRNNKILLTNIETVCYKELIPGELEPNEKIHVVHGVLIRGPNHATRTTDRVNCFIIQFYKNLTMDVKDMSKCSFGRCTVLTDEGEIKLIYSIRRYAITKVSPTFYSFCSINLFEPFFSLGEIILRVLEANGFNENINTKEIIDQNYDFFELRFIKAVINCLNFKNFDEGLRPFARIELLNSVARADGERSFAIDPKSYLDELYKEYNWSGVMKRIIQMCIF